MICQLRRVALRRLRLDLAAVRRLTAFGFRLELALRRALRFVAAGFLFFPPKP